MEKYKIGIVDDEALFCQGLSMVIENHEHLEVAITAKDGVDLMNQLGIADELPDLVLCDLEMPNMDGVEVTKEICEKYEDIKIVILSSHYEPSLIMKMMEIGASAFMPKDEKPEEFYNTILNVIEKGFHYNEYVIQLINERMRFGASKKQSPDIDLSKREMEVLNYLCQQKTNKEIAELMFISSRTVEGHRQKLLAKTGSKNTAGIIIYAIENGYYSINIKNLKWS